MKRRSLLLMMMVAGVLITACSAGGNKDSTEKKTLVAGTEGTMFPWTYVEDNKIVGFGADIIAEISKRTGYDIEMKAMDWSGLFGNLDAKRVDTVANIVTITDERKEKYVFTQPYVYNPMVLATKADSDINSLDDIDGRTIVVEVGSSDEMVLKQLEDGLGVDLEPVYYEGISITDVENGRVDLWIGGEPSLNTNIEAGYDLKIIGQTGSYQEYGYPFLIGDEGEALCSVFDNALTEMKKDGTLKNISEKWFKMDITQKPE